MKTFKECCDIIAKKLFGHDSLDMDYLHKNRDHRDFPKFFSQAADLYASEIAKEAIGLAKEEIWFGHFPESKYTEQEILSKLGLLEE